MIEYLRSASAPAFLGTRLVEPLASLNHEAMAAQLSLITELMGISLWELDIERQWFTANRTGFEIAGIPVPESGGMPLADLRARAHPDDIPALEQAVAQACLPQAGVVDVETRYLQRDGTYRTLLSRRVARRDASGRAVSLIGVSLDITEQKRTAVLRREHAQAEEANRAKSEFLANMSHEIRTPMNAIIGMSHLALRSGLNPQQFNYVSKVERSARALLGMINDILDFSKIEAGKLDVENVEFQLDDVLSELSAGIGLQAHQKGLELLFVESPELPRRLIGDPRRLGQVLANLGNNAVKFTEHGEVIVTLNVEASDESSTTLRFSVRDSGIGMTQSEQEGLFRPFTQADASNSRRYGGTGLGLTICHRLVQRMGGELQVQSAPGAGSTFSFSLRFERPPGRGSKLRSLRLFAGRRMLIVDDNAAAREILTTLAHNFGLDVEAANDGLDALRRAAHADSIDRPFALVLIDWQMPGMDGVECARQIGAMLNEHRPVVLMATSFGREDLISRIAAAGVTVDDVIGKPVTPGAMLDTVSRVLDLPLALDSRPQPLDVARTAHQRQLRGAHLLLAEDNEINRELAIELLSHVGIIVTPAVDGAQALALMEEHPFDGVLMDCQMPVMDGYEAARAIRADPRWSELPIIAMTANALAGDRDQALAVGMNDHIAKPIEIDAMFKTLARWIKPRATSD